MDRLILIISCFLAVVQLSAQSTNGLIRQGNKSYDKGKFDQAEGAYNKALSKDSSNTKATFNLGAAQYEQKQYDKAVSQFRSSVDKLKDPAQKADAWYNLGNSLYKQKQLEESVNAYKESLRLNPNHDNARYNLAMARKKLQQQQQQQNNQNKDDQKKDDQKKNDQQKDDQKRNDKNKPEEHRNDDQNKEQQPQKPQTSDQQLQQLLKAIDQEESKVQQKLYNKGEGKPTKKSGKDW